MQNDETTFADYRIVTIPVETAAATVRVDRRREKRNLRRNGATFKAAGRLARYRLRKFLKANAATAVSDTVIGVNRDFTTDTTDVYATVRNVKLPPGLDANFRVPNTTAAVNIAVPPS